MSNKGLLVVGIMGLSWILVVLGTAFIPFYARKSIAFGVSIPESEYYSKFFTQLRRYYLATGLILGSVLAVGSTLTYIWVNAKTAMWIHLATMFIYLAFIAVLYLVFYRKVRAYKQNSNWPIAKISYAVLTPDKDEKMLLSPLWFLTYLAAIAGTITVAIIKYPSLPGTIPMHYNIAGQVDRYALKSVSTFILIPIIQLLLGLLFLGMNFAISRSKRQGGVGDIASGLKKDRAFQIIMSKTLFWIGLFTMLLFGTIQLAMLQILGRKFTIIAPVVFLLAILAIVTYWITKVGQGGSRMSGGKVTTSKLVEDDSRWILGVFYYNKSDPSFFVEKRFGLGYTVNFGNPRSWLAIVALLALIAVVAILPHVLH
ncbi:MAG: DUF5808 domain-containing protein [Peptococcaceae bacterium]|nr:DUF5808 domain-containing protein [Peptococcaceae bacterium]